MNKVSLGDILTESKVESLNPDANHRITVRLNVKGVQKRPIKNDMEGATKYYTRSFNQFIYGKQNLFKGAFGIIPKELDGFETSSDLPCFDIDINRCKPEWILYFFKKGDFYKTLEKIARGAGSKRISPKDFFKIKIPLPSLPEQEIILNKMISIERDGINLEDEISKQQKLLKKLHQSILQEAIEGKLTASWREQNSNIESASILLEKIKAEKKQLIKDKKIKAQKPLPKISEDEIPFDIPDSWEWCRLQDISNNIHYGFNASAKPNKFDVRMLRITDIQNNSVNWNTVPGCDYTEKDLKSYSLSNNDILIARTGGTIGKSYIVKGITVTSLFASYLIRVIPNSILNADFLKLFIESPFYWKQLYEAAWGAGQPNVNGTSLSKLILSLPPIEEQKAIVKKIENLFKICDELESQINSSKTNSQTLMQAVLKEAFEQKEEILPRELEAEVVAAFILDKFQHKKKFGRVKLQKILYLHETANNLDFGSDYKKIKHAMGPHDYVFLKKIENNLKEKGWFDKIQEEGEKGRVYYPALNKADEYKKHLSAVHNRKELEDLINTMMDFDLNQSEVVATLYAVWKEENDYNIFGTVPDNILIKKALGWHDRKDNIPKEYWPWGINWLRSQKLIF